MSLEGRLGDIAIKNFTPIYIIYAIYNGKLDVLKKQLGEQYKGRESHLRVMAYNNIKEQILEMHKK